MNSQFFQFSCAPTPTDFSSLIALIALPESESESYVTTDSQSASLSWYKAPVWGLRPDFYCRRTVAGLLMWGALSDERTGLSFTIATGPSQRSHSLFRAPLDSRAYFTVSDLRLPISSSPTTRRVTVEDSTPPPHGFDLLALTGKIPLKYVLRLVLAQGFAALASVSVAAGTQQFT
jgi:hypothetical protein